MTGAKVTGYRTPENRGGGQLDCPNKFCSDFARGLSGSERIWTLPVPMSVGVSELFWPLGPALPGPLTPESPVTMQINLVSEGINLAGRYGDMFEPQHRK